MKTSSKELQPIWEELQDIFSDPCFSYNEKVGKRLKKLGFIIIQVKGNHPKLYIPLHGKTYVITMCCSPSKPFLGKQILRQIRRVYEKGY